MGLLKPNFPCVGDYRVPAWLLFLSCIHNCHVNQKLELQLSDCSNFEFLSLLVVDMEMGSPLAQWARPSKTALFFNFYTWQFHRSCNSNPFLNLQGPVPADQAGRPFILDERRDLAIHDMPIIQWCWASIWISLPLSCHRIGKEIWRYIPRLGGGFLFPFGEHVKTFVFHKHVPYWPWC